MSESPADETIQAMPTPAVDSGADSSLAATVQMPAPAFDSDVQPTQRMEQPNLAAGESQPTERVEPKPTVDTLPTIPAPSFVASNPTLASSKTTSTEPPPFIRRSGQLNLPFSTGWLIAGAAGIGILLILFGCALSASTWTSWLIPSTPTPTATTTPTLTPTLKPSPTLPPTQTPVPASPTPVVPTNTPRPAPTRLEIGVLAQVSPPAGLKLRVRDRAGTGGAILGELDAGAQVKIVEGPLDANNLKWWKIDNGQGLVGWSAEGSGNDVYLTPIGWAP